MNKKYVIYMYTHTHTHTHTHWNSNQCKWKWNFAICNNMHGFGGYYANWLPCGSDGKASAYNAGDPGSIPGSGRSHSSILAWKIPWMEEPSRATVHGVTKSWTRLSDFAFMLTEISQTEKYKYYMISLICRIRKIQQTSEYYKQEADSWI